ncbi:MAG: hypothetical protein H6907_17140 [Hyphomicrobiales bacterium]|nr:hypothetical protein [Hyphomicrobiales bacterium]
MSERPTYRFREADPSVLPGFVAQGYPERHLFPHRVVFMRKCAPDAFKRARAMCGPCRADDLWQAVLFAGEATARELPASLYFDDDVAWHRQQFGLSGHVAYATFAVRDGALHGLFYVSDIVQRQDRTGPHRTRVNTLFRGWPYLLFHSLVSFAAERGIRQVRSPMSDLVMSLGDPARTVRPEMFRRIYDHAVNRHFVAERDGDWWRLDVARNRSRLVPLATGREALWDGSRTICLYHDTEAGFGHRHVDPAFADRSDETWRATVESMVACERRHGVAATYNVVGTLFPEARALIGNDGAALAFHSADHADPGKPRLPGILNRLRAVRSLRKVGTGLAERRAGLHSAELSRCRQIDYRTRGYRPPRSRLATSLTANRLAYYNFDWLVSSRASLGIDAPELDGPVARIPTLFDDIALYRGTQTYDDWERTALRRVAESRFVAFGLHDCYGEHWLPHYDGLLSRLAGMGRLTTLDQVANELFLATAV